MGLAYSPRIVTNGLVFAYDMENAKKSYKGPPLSNLAKSVNIWTGVATGYSSTSLLETVDIPGLGKTQVYSNIIQNNYTAFTPNSGNCCPSLHSWGYFNVSPSTLYTYAIVYRCDSGYTNTNYMYRYEYTANGGSYVTEGGVFSTARRVSLGNGWYYAWGTFTTQATTNWINHAGTFYYRYSQTTDKLSIAKVMIVEGDYSGLHPKYWPDTETARSNTEAILDLTGNHIVNPNGSPYNNDGEIILNGNNEYLYTDGGNFWNAWSPDGSYGNSEMSIELVFSSSDTSGLLISRPWNGSGQYNYAFSPTNMSLHVGSNSTNASYSNISTGNITHMIWWMTPTNFGAYKNGVSILNSTHTLTGGGASSGTNAFGTLFGSLYPYGSSWTGNTSFSIAGTFYLAKIYNRALSATEIKRNFDAVKWRYGL